MDDIFPSSRSRKLNLATPTYLNRYWLCLLPSFAAYLRVVNPENLDAPPISASLPTSAVGWQFAIKDICDGHSVGSIGWGTRANL